MDWNQRKKWLMERPFVILFLALALLIIVAIVVKSF